MLTRILYYADTGAVWLQGSTERCSLDCKLYEGMDIGKGNPNEFQGEPTAHRIILYMYVHSSATDEHILCTVHFMYRICLKVYEIGYLLVYGS
jgi:hypothetical protein